MLESKSSDARPLGGEEGDWDRTPFRCPLCLRTSSKPCWSLMSLIYSRSLWMAWARQMTLSKAVKTFSGPQRHMGRGEWLAEFCTHHLRVVPLPSWTEDIPKLSLRCLWGSHSCLSDLAYCWKMKFWVPRKDFSQVLRKTLVEMRNWRRLPSSSLNSPTTLLLGLNTFPRSRSMCK